MAKKRKVLPWWKVPLRLWFAKTHVKVFCNKMISYKVGRDGRHYILKVEDLPPMDERFE